MVQWEAGQRLTASKLSTTRLHAAATGTQTLSDTYADLTGASLTFTTTRDNVDVSVIGIIHFQASASPTGSVLGRLNVDGTVEPDLIRWSDDAGDQNTPGQTWVVNLATAGSHTIKLQARGTTASAYDITSNSTIQAIVEDNV